MKFNKKKIFGAIMTLALCLSCIAIPNRAQASSYYYTRLGSLKILTGSTPGISTDTYYLDGNVESNIGIDRVEVTLYRKQDNYAKYRTGSVSFKGAMYVDFSQSPELSHLLSQNTWGDYKVELCVYDKGNGGYIKTYMNYTVEKSLGSYMAGLYKNFLLRDPDLKGYVGNMQMVSFHRITIEGMVRAFYDGAEHQNKRNQFSNENFINALYRGILGRNPDSQGFTNYVNKLRSGANRRSVVNEFLASREFKNSVTPSFKFECHE